MPVNASAWNDGRLHVRLSGAAAAVHSACGKLGGALADPGAARIWWMAVRDQTHEFFCLSEDRLAAGESLWRLSVPAATAPIQLPGRQFIEWHGAERWWRTAAGAHAVRAAAAQAGGMPH